MKAPKSEAARTAQAQAGSEIYRETVGLLKEIAKNPIAEVIIGVALIEKMQRNGLIGEAWGTTIQGGLIGIVTAQQLAPLVPYMADAVKGLLPGAASVLVK